MNKFVLLKNPGVDEFGVSNCAGTTYGTFDRQAMAERLRDQLNAGLAAQAANAELLAALEWLDGENAPKDGSEFFIYYGEPTIARWQPDGSDFPWIFLDSQDGKFIFNRLKSLKDVGWKPISVLKAIKKADE